MLLALTAKISSDSFASDHSEFLLSKHAWIMEHVITFGNGAAFDNAYKNCERNERPVSPSSWGFENSALF